MKDEDDEDKHNKGEPKYLTYDVKKIGERERLGEKGHAGKKIPNLVS